MVVRNGFIFLTAPLRPIDLECTVTPNSAMTFFSYSCNVTLGDGQQDILVCTLDNEPITPCEFVIIAILYKFQPSHPSACLEGIKIALSFPHSYVCFFVCLSPLIACIKLCHCVTMPSTMDAIGRFSRPNRPRYVEICLA